MKYFVPYLIMGIPLVLLLVHFKKGKMGGLQFVTVGSLTLSMVIYFLFHSGIIGQYLIKVGDKEFYVSPSAFDKVITENMDRFAVSLSTFYKKYHQLDAFELGAPSDRIVLTNDSSGRFTARLKLSHHPIAGTIQVEVSDGQMKFNSKDPVLSADSNNWVEIHFTMPETEARNWIKDSSLEFGISYLREIEEKGSTL